MNFAFVHVRVLRAAILSATAFISNVEHSHAAEVGAEVAKDSTKLSAEQRKSLEPVLRGLLQAHVDVQERVPGQAPIIVVGDVSFNDSGDELLVELGKGYVPTYYGGDFEDRINALATTVYVYMDKIGPLRGVDFTFEGRDILDYFPYEKGLKEQAEMSQRQTLFHRADAGKGRVLVSAGHGYYFHKKFGWTTQRSLVNGLIEDFATPAFAASLDSYLGSRAGAEVFRARSQARDRHAESGKPWTDMASRYFLKNMLPNAPEIWNSKPGKGGDMEEYEQDIRSRPLYANHLGVDAAIHLHTNATENPNTRGIRIFYTKGRDVDERLATVGLCYIKESLKSNAAFEAVPVASEPSIGRYGENTYATMPSIVAEIGFHTNKEDAAAIGSYVFRDLAMRGLEKGYRMFREGRGCEEFTVTHPEVNLVSDTPYKADVVFAGAPRFPVKYEMAVAECTPGIICTPRYGRFKDPAAPLTIDYGCTAIKDHPFTIKWDASFIDADGIEAKAPVTMTCKPKASRRA
jgi:N-acetylmuramoyl-L-alanine amidase